MNLDHLMKFLVRPKVSDKKTYLLSEVEQRSLRREVGGLEFENSLKSISHAVLNHGCLADRVSNIHAVMADNGLVLAFDLVD